ncbi:MFS transporter small subunit [Saccharopolyspora halophila]
MNTANRKALLVVAWLWVTLPFLYGLAALVQKVSQLFTG